jgi:hypothetical protein
MIGLGRCRAVVVASVQWSTPSPAAVDRSASVTAAAAVLSSDTGWGWVTGWRPGGGHPAVRTEQPTQVTAPLSDIAAWHEQDAAGSLDLALGGSMLTILPGALQ